MGISTTSPSRGSRTGSRVSSISWARNTPRSATRSAAARRSPTTSARGCAPPSPSTNRSRRADGEASRAAPADQVRPEHAQDHEDDGARRHVQAEARAGPGDRRAAVRGGAAVDLHLVGKKGITYFRFAKRPVASQRLDIGDKPTATHAAELAAPLMAQFASGAVDAVEVVFAQFRSAVATPPTTLRILPVTPPRSDGRM